MKQTVEIEILKEKKGKATKIQFNGEEYALIHKDYINGNKNKVKKGRKK